MKASILKLSIVIGILVFTILGSSCEKIDDLEEQNQQEEQNNDVNNDVTPTDNAMATAKEDATAQTIFADVFKQVDESAKSTNEDLISGNKSLKAGEAYLTITPFDLTTWPKTMTIDYGDDNVLCYDGIYRRGVITTEVSDFYTNAGCVITVNFEDYYMNENKVEGTKIITNQGRNSNNNLVYSIDIQDAKITTPENSVSYWSSVRDNEWINGESTIDPNDDEWLVTGSANGTNSNGTLYTIDITEQLNVLVGCQYIRSGKLDIQIDGLPQIDVDYGSGACDGDATAIVYGYSYPFTMYWGEVL